MRPVCFPSVVARFCGVVRGALCFAVLLSLSLCSHARYFRPCWLFSLSGVFSVGCVAFVRSVAKFKPLTVAQAAPLPLGASSRAVLRSVIRSGGALLPSVAGELLKAYPLPYYVLMRGGAVLPPISHIKIIFRKTYIYTYTFQKTI